MAETPQELLEKLPDELNDEANAVSESMGIEDTEPETGPEDVEASEDDGLTLVDDSTPDFDRHYLRLFETGVGSKENDKLLVSFSESGVPEMVQERMRDVIMGGALFSDFENIPSSDLMELRTEFANMLTEDGWTTDILTDQIQELEPQLEDYEAERIARTETQHIVNESRKQAYQERGLEDAQFKWVGTDDHRNAEFDGVEICREIAQRTDPKLGGTPRTLDELDELIQEIHSDLGVNTSYREFTPHINCRHTYVRHVE